MPLILPQRGLVDPRSRRGFLTGAAALAAFAALPADAQNPLLHVGTAGGTAAAAWQPSDEGSAYLLDIDPDDATKVTTSGGLIDSLTPKGAITEPFTAAGGNRFTLTAASINGKASMDGNNKIMGMANNVTVNAASGTAFIGIVLNTANHVSGYDEIFGVNGQATSGWGVWLAGGATFGYQPGDAMAFAGNGFDGTAPRTIVQGAASLNTGTWISQGYLVGNTAAVYVGGVSQTLRGVGGTGTKTGATASTTAKCYIGSVDAFSPNTYDLKIARLIVFDYSTGLETRWQTWTTAQFGV